MCCYLIVSMAMALMAYVPERSQAPLGWLYVGVGLLFITLLFATVPRRRAATEIAARATVST